MSGVPRAAPLQTGAHHGRSRAAWRDRFRILSLCWPSPLGERGRAAACETIVGPALEAIALRRSIYRLDKPQPDCACANAFTLARRRVSVAAPSSAPLRSAPEPATPMEFVAELDARATTVATPCGSGRMVWRCWGEGTPLVLLHGGYGSWTHWIRNIDGLAARHRV